MYVCVGGFAQSAMFIAFGPAIANPSEPACPDLPCHMSQSGAYQIKRRMNQRLCGEIRQITSLGKDTIESILGASVYLFALCRQPPVRPQLPLLWSFDFHTRRICCLCRTSIERIRIQSSLACFCALWAVNVRLARSEKCR